MYYTFRKIYRFLVCSLISYLKVKTPTPMPPRPRNRILPAPEKPYLGHPEPSLER